MNNELMEQCRREAEEWAVSEVGKRLKLNTVDERVREIIIERNDQSIQGYAAALYAERSKRRELTDERIFTESEVRAKDEDLKWALNWINNEAKHLREMGQPQEALEVALDMILERHGIVLDPQ